MEVLHYVLIILVAVIIVMFWKLRNLMNERADTLTELAKTSNFLSLERQHTTTLKAERAQHQHDFQVKIADCNEHSAVLTAQLYQERDHVHELRVDLAQAKDKTAYLSTKLDKEEAKTGRLSASLLATERKHRRRLQQLIAARSKLSLFEDVEAQLKWAIVVNQKKQLPKLKASLKLNKPPCSSTNTNSGNKTTTISMNNSVLPGFCLSTWKPKRIDEDMKVDVGINSNNTTTTAGMGGGEGSTQVGGGGTARVSGLPPKCSSTTNTNNNNTQTVGGTVVAVRGVDVEAATTAGKDKDVGETRLFALPPRCIKHKVRATMDRSSTMSGTTTTTTVQCYAVQPPLENSPPHHMSSTTTTNTQLITNNTQSENVGPAAAAATAVGQEQGTAKPKKSGFRKRATSWFTQKTPKAEQPSRRPMKEGAGGDAYGEWIQIC